MTSIRALLANPAVLVGLVRVVMILVVSFGAAMTQGQQDSILEATGALMAVLSLALTGVTVTQTTPTSAPVLGEGTVVEVVTPPGERNRMTVL